MGTTTPRLRARATQDRPNLGRRIPEIIAFVSIVAFLGRGLDAEQSVDRVGGLCRGKRTCFVQT